MFKSINQYIIKEFLKNLLTVTTVMFFLVLFITFLDEFAFFKAKQDLKFIYFLLFTFLKIPNALLNLSSKKINIILYFFYILPFFFLIINKLILDYFIDYKKE